MNVTEFHSLADQLFNDIESFLDDYADKRDLDIDYETHGNVITVSFENASKIIINKQEPLFQIWLATRNQGYHFDYLDNQWICNRTNKPFDIIFQQAVQEQSN